MNIFQRINEVRKAITYVQKDKSVSTGGSSYKAVTHDTVTAMVRPEMVKNGIVCFPDLVASMSLPKEEGSKQFRYEATYAFHFVNIDEPTDRLTITIQAHAMDNADKAPGKALSYAKKYAMLKLFEIETGEDEESRYQTEDIDIEAHIGIISSAESLDELKAVFASSFKAAEDARDKEAMKAIIAAKDSRKKALSGEQPNSTASPVLDVEAASKAIIGASSPEQAKKYLAKAIGRATTEEQKIALNDAYRCYQEAH